jgi:hypothetical protein
LHDHESDSNDDENDQGEDNDKDGADGDDDLNGQPRGFAVVGVLFAF